MTNKIKIKRVLIKTNEKEFAIYPSATKEQVKNHNKEIEDFKKGKLIAKEEVVSNYRKETIIHYYSGLIEFMPVKDGESSISMEISLNQDIINSIVAMCLDNVCSLCEKQTKAFQDTFVEFVENNAKSLKNNLKSVEEGLFKRTTKKLLRNDK